MFSHNLRAHQPCNQLNIIGFFRERLCAAVPLLKFLESDPSHVEVGRCSTASPQQAFLFQGRRVLDFRSPGGGRVSPTTAHRVRERRCLAQRCDAGGIALICLPIASMTVAVLASDGFDTSTVCISSILHLIAPQSHSASLIRTVDRVVRVGNDTLCDSLWAAVRLIPCRYMVGVE